MCPRFHSVQCLHGMSFALSERSVRLRSGQSIVIGLEFPDFVFAELMDVLVRTLRVLREESELLGLQVSWLKAKLQPFGDPVC